MLTLLSVPLPQGITLSEGVSVEDYALTLPGGDKAGIIYREIKRQGRRGMEVAFYSPLPTGGYLSCVMTHPGLYDVPRRDARHAYQKGLAFVPFGIAGRTYRHH